MRFTLIIPLLPGRDAEIIGAIKELDYDKSKFHVLVAPGYNPSAQRNKCVDRAKGDYVVFLDDDAVIEKDYLIEIDKFLDNHPEVDVVGGPQLSPKDEEGFGKISGYALSSKFGAWKLSNRYSANEESLDVDETALTSANLVCKKEVFEKVRFDENLFPGEDPKFIADSKLAGLKVAYTPTFILYHKRRPTFKAFVKQMFNYGKTRPKKESFFETLKIPFFFIPSLFVIYLVLLIASIINNPGITGNVAGITSGSLTLESLLFVPLFAYIILVIFFTFYDSIKNNDLGSADLLFFMYPTIHISYGVGMIYGYLRKVFN